MTADKICALTFDDGPSRTTDQVLDTLSRFGIPASFFLIGRQIVPDTIPAMKRALGLGCEIHNHSWTHDHVAAFSEGEIRGEIDRTTAAIERAVGVTPAFFRPPYLETSDALYRAAGLPVIGGICCEDWLDDVSAETRAATILRDVRDGSIILMHDMEGNFRTVDALDILIPGLRAGGYRFVTVSALFRERNVNPAVAGKIWHRAER